MVVSDLDPAIIDSYLRYSEDAPFRPNRYAPPAGSVTIGRLSDTGNVEAIDTEQSDANGTDGNSLGDSANARATERPPMSIPPPRATPRRRTNAFPYSRARLEAELTRNNANLSREDVLNSQLDDANTTPADSRPSVRIESPVRPRLYDDSEAGLETDTSSSTTARTDARARFPRPILHWRPSGPGTTVAFQPRQQEATPTASPTLPSNDQPLPVYFSSAEGEEESPWDWAERAILRVRRAQARSAASETEERRPLPSANLRLYQRWRAYRQDSLSSSRHSTPTQPIRIPPRRYSRNSVFSPGYETPPSDPDNEEEDTFINTSPCPDGSPWGSLLATANQLRRRRRSSTSASAWMDSAMGEMRGLAEERSGKRRKIRELDEPGR